MKSIFYKRAISAAVIFMLSACSLFAQKIGDKKTFLVAVDDIVENQCGTISFFDIKTSETFYFGGCCSGRNYAAWRKEFQQIFNTKDLRLLKTNLYKISFEYAKATCNEGAEDYTRVRWVSSGLEKVAAKNTAPQKRKIYAVINDPDGYTNIREGFKDSKIIGRIVNGEQFQVFISSFDDWWEVITKSGLSGYVHKSRIKII